MSREESSKDPVEVLAEAEQQWMYTEEELLHTPSILDGMSPEEERQLRSKGTNFITQVGIMLKLPQTTLCTASIFFNRFLMRHSLVKKEGHKPLHHYVSKTPFDPQSQGPLYQPRSATLSSFLVDQKWKIYASEFAADKTTSKLQQHLFSWPRKSKSIHVS